MLTNQATAPQVPIPHEQDEWMKFKPLSWRQLEDASKARTIAAIMVASEIPAGVFDKMGDISRAKDDVVPEPTELYDTATVLNASITAWSYDAEVTPENIESLDEATSTWAHKVAMGLSIRSQPEGEDSAPSSNGITSGMGVGQKS